VLDLNPANLSSSAGTDMGHWWHQEWHQHTSGIVSVHWKSPTLYVVIVQAL